MGAKLDGKKAIDRFVNMSLDESEDFEADRPAHKVPHIPTTPRGGKKPAGDGKKIRWNLTLEPELNDFMRFITIKREIKNMTTYINDLIRADKEAYEAECEKKGIDPYGGWV